MTQSNIIKLLKKKRRWMTSKEISKILNISSANLSPKKLYEHGEILRKESKVKGNHLTYKYKIK